MESFVPGTPLPFEECENFRELGGYVGAAGKRVKRGVFYRSAALHGVQSARDVALFESLGIKVILDFRSGGERELTPDPAFRGARHIDAPALLLEGGEATFDLQAIFAGGQSSIDEMLAVVANGYTTMPFQNPAYRTLFSCIAAGETPVLFHCTAGKDRTGLAAALILKALGVGEDDILRDYMRTNDLRARSTAGFMQKFAGKIPQDALAGVTKTVLGVEAENLKASFRAIETRYPVFADYLREECGMGAEALIAMRQNYLE